MARFISMGILSYESGYVRRGFRTLDDRWNDEQRVELADKPFLSAEAFDEPLYIVRNQPCILPTVALAVVVGAMSRCERAVFLSEPSFAVLASDES